MSGIIKAVVHGNHRQRRGSPLDPWHNQEKDKLSVEERKVAAATKPLWTRFVNAEHEIHSGIAGIGLTGVGEPPRLPTAGPEALTPKIATRW